jgi:hypothetical protein
MAACLLVAILAGLAGCDTAPSTPPASQAPPASPHIQEPVKGGRLETWNRDLSQDERRGGHTIARHVGKTDEQLRDRLRRERRLSTASSYTDLVTAERVVGEALQDGRARIERWQARKGSRPNLALDYQGHPGTVIGRALRRGAREPQSCEHAVVVLRWDAAAGDYYVLTSYPEIRR